MPPFRRRNGGKNALEGDDRTMNRTLLTRLEQLRQQDIETRAALLHEGRLYGTYAPEMQKIHHENAEALDALVSEYGWPGISKVGLEGCRAAWLIAQHAICTPELQRKFLLLLSKAAETGDVPMKQVAWLTDRIRFNENRPQLYGTVLDWDPHGELTCELEDPEHIDDRRAAVGLPPFEQSLEAQRKEIEAEGGKPPENYEVYKNDALAWMKSVGW